MKFARIGANIDHPFAAKLAGAVAYFNTDEYRQVYHLPFVLGGVGLKVGDFEAEPINFWRFLAGLLNNRRIHKQSFGY